MTKLRHIVAALVVVVGAISAGTMLRHRDYDNDEVTWAHSVWLTSQDLRPYSDFFECHPPYFALLSPLARTVSDPADLLAALRLFSVVGNLLFLAGLVSVTARAAGAGRLAAIFGTSLVACHPTVLGFLTEFRIDGWGYALTLWNIAWFLRSPRPRRCFGLGLGTGIATLLLSPKLGMLPPMIMAAEQVRARGPWRGAVRAFAAYGAGVGAALVLFWAWLRVNGIDVGLFYAYVVRYHALSNLHSGFGHGLLRAVAERPSLSGPLAAAFAVWVAGWVREKRMPAAYPTALALWLPAQLLLVASPGKQYYGLWFLLASCFGAAVLPALDVFMKRGAPVLVCGLGALSMAASSAAAHDTAASRGLTRMHEAFLRTVNRLTTPEDFIATLSFVHPIYRRDTFYLWYTTIDSVYGTEEILQDLPLVRDRVSEGQYRDELQRHPPALVVLPESFPRRQRAVLKEFISKRRYVESRIENVPVAVRPDRFNDFRRGLAADRASRRGPGVDVSGPTAPGFP